MPMLAELVDGVIGVDTHRDTLAAAALTPVGGVKTSAATQLRSGMRRGTPPRGRGGGAGSSGWTRCHSASGRSRSTRLLMPGASKSSPNSSSAATDTGKSPAFEAWRVR
jgi:hypothetical protein